MDSVQTLPPTVPPSGLKSAMSVLDQEIHDGLLQDSGPSTPTFEYPLDYREVPSRGRDPVPKPVYTNFSPVDEASPKNPTAVFADLQQQLKDDLAKRSRPSTPSDTPRAHFPKPILVNSARDIKDSQKSPTAIFERLGIDFHNELAQSSGPPTPTEEMANPPPADSELAPSSLHSPLTATFSKLPRTLQHDVAQVSAPITPVKDAPDPIQTHRASQPAPRKPGSPIDVAHFNSLASASHAHLNKLARDSESAQPAHDGESEPKRADSAQSPLSASFDNLPPGLKDDLARPSEPASPAPAPMEESGKSAEPLSSTFEKLPARLHEEVARAASPARPA